MTAGAINPLLFVYGTLLSSVDHPMARRLGREADLLGPATFAGRLYRVSWYPGMVDGGERDGVLLKPASGDECRGITRGLAVLRGRP